MKICVVGMGYVGLSLSVLLSQRNEVVCCDISKEKVDLINERKSPFSDNEIEKFLTNKDLDIKATTNSKKAYSDSELIIVATPTNYNAKSNSFDTSTVENVIVEIIENNAAATIIIKSTIPLGFTEQIKSKFKKNNIIFSPEFLRETRALYDNLYPSRIIVGDNTPDAKVFANLLAEVSLLPKDQISIFFMNSREAESVKLFSNTYLAMRVSFFNELDSFCETNRLSSKNIINGVSSDQRIGNYYNNPSFGYGGYCLPKDTKQLLDSFSNIPNSIIKAVVKSNKLRKDFILKSIINKSPKTLGVYRLIMKEGSDNFRESAVLDIINNLKKEKIDIILYEPSINENSYKSIPVFKNIGEFIKKSDLIIANRLAKELETVKDKVYSRDIFQEN